MKTNRTKKYGAPLIVACALFTVYAVTLIFPLVWLFVNSFKNNAGFMGDIWGLPDRFRFSNYYTAFVYEVSGTSVAGMIVHSFVLTIFGCAASVFFSVCAAYSIAKYRFPGRGFIYGFVYILMIVPAVGGMTGTYRLLHSLRLFDSLFGMVVLYSGAFGMNFLILYAYYKNLSWTYAEAAFMDGASRTQVFFTIMIPLAVPVIVSLSILQFISLWNDFMSPYIYLPSMPTLAVGLDLLNTEMNYRSNYPVLFSLMIVSIIPVMLVYICFQDVIMKNTVAGGIKG